MIVFITVRFITDDFGGRETDVGSDDKQSLVYSIKYNKLKQTLLLLLLLLVVVVVVVVVAPFVYSSPNNCSKSSLSSILLVVYSLQWNY